MITTGQTLTNSVTGETLVFRTTSADTNGERVVVETFVEPNGAVAAAHVHPAQEELFEILAGELEFRLGKQTIVAKPGDRVLVPPGPRTGSRTSATRPRTSCARSPALGFEQLIETMFSLAADGKVNKKGMPNPLRLAVIARHHFGDVRLPFPPAWLQRLGLAFGAPARPAARLPADLRAGGPEGARPRSASSAPPRPLPARSPARPARPAGRRRVQSPPPDPS